VNLRREVSKTLRARGFRQFERMHLRPVDSEFSLWVDTGPIGSRSDIAPFVGLRHDRTEHLVPELLDVPYFDWTATVGANVGYVLGEEYQRWNPPSTADEVLVAVDAALETLKDFMPLSRLPEAWNIRGAQTPGWRFHEIVVFYLLEDRMKMNAKLEAARASLCQTEDGVCEQFRGFEKRLLALTGRRAPV